MKYFSAHSRKVGVYLAATVIMFSYGCTKTIHDRRPTTTDSPEARESFGFNLNGRYFKSEERTGNVSGSCSYTENHNAGRKFRIQANHSGRNCASNSIEIILDSVDIQEGARYNFGSPGSGKNYLTVSSVVECDGSPVAFTSNDDNFGYVIITRFQPSKNVISGSFSCIGKNEFGVTFQISDGYFDRHFTR